MSILTGPEIKKMYESGAIHISPWNEDQLGPNSYDLRLDNVLKVTSEFELDCRESPEWDEFVIPERGFLLHPNALYLGSTIEEAGSDWFVPDVSGKSRIGRFGISVHNTAGWGDTGFSGQMNGGATWTLEISCIQPVRIYAGMKICQVRFSTVEGKLSRYNGNYVNQVGPTGPQYRECK